MDEKQKELLSIQDFLQIYSIARSRCFSHMKSGKLKSIKIGRRTYIKRVDAEKWMDSLGKEG